MWLFSCALRFSAKPGGIVEASPNMGAVGVRFSYIVGSTIQNEFVHIEALPLLEGRLRR